MSQLVRELKSYGFGGNSWGIFDKTIFRLRLKTRDNAHYKQRSFLLCLLYIAVTMNFAEGGVGVLNFNRDSFPDADTLFYHLKKFNQGEVEEALRRMQKEIFAIAKRQRAFSRPVYLAIDYHDIPYYGKKRDAKVVGTKKKAGTNYAHCFATSNVVIKGERFTLDVVPVTQFSRKEKVVEKLIGRALKKVRIKLILLDKGFKGVAVIKTIIGAKLQFLMPAVETKRVRELIFEFRAGRVPAIHDYTIKSGKEQVDVKLVLAWKGEKAFGYFTNMELTEEEATKIPELYSRRWGIETSYRVTGDFRARTCSNNYIVRLLYFLLSVYLYNIWILVNLLLRRKSRDGTAEKPLVPAMVLRKILEYKIVGLAYTESV